MTRLDRAFMTWAQGQKRVRICEYLFTRSHLFFNGITIAVRYRDEKGHLWTFIRDSLSEGRLDCLLKPEKHLRKGKWFVIESDDFLTISNAVSTVEGVRDVVSQHWTHLKLSQAERIGVSIKRILEVVRAGTVSSRNTILKYPEAAEAVFFNDDVVEPPELVGALYLLRSKGCAALTYCPDGRIRRPRGAVALKDGGRDSATTKIMMFGRIEDAVLDKMSNSGITLFEP